MRVFLAMQLLQQALALTQAQVHAVVFSEALLQLFATPLPTGQAKFRGGDFYVMRQGVHGLFRQA